MLLFAQESMYWLTGYDCSATVSSSAWFSRRRRYPDHPRARFARPAIRPCSTIFDLRAR
jgi:hypothetical protein